LLTQFFIISFLSIASLSCFAMTATQVSDQIDAIHHSCPSVTNKVSLGQNDLRQDIFALRISTTPEKIDAAKIGFFIVGGHHGNEQHSVTLALHLARSVARRMTLPVFRDNTMLDTEWWVVPAVNLPGLEHGHRWEQGRDPNREYKGPCHAGTTRPLKSIQSIVDTLERRTFTAAATLHGYIGTLTSPWGVTTPNPKPIDYPTYETWLRKASRHNGYAWGTSSEMIYPANGTFEDYVFWKFGMWSLLVELKTGNTLDLADTTDAVLEFFTQVNATRAQDPSATVSCHHSPFIDLHLE
jgi:carboxypeptidase T